MDLQVNIQLLILACKTPLSLLTPIGVSPHYTHALQLSMDLYPNTHAHNPFLLTERMGEHNVLRGENTGTELEKGKFLIK